MTACTHSQALSTALVDETHVAESALVRHLENNKRQSTYLNAIALELSRLLYFFELARVNRIQLAAGRIVYHVKKSRKRLAEVETTAAAVTDVKYPAHFLARRSSSNTSVLCFSAITHLVKSCWVIKVGGCPLHRVPK